MKIRMTRAYATYKAGEVVDVAPELAARLIAWEYAREERQRTLIETAAVEPVTETASANPKRRRQ